MSVKLELSTLIEYSPSFKAIKSAVKTFPLPANESKRPWLILISSIVKSRISSLLVNTILKIESLITDSLVKEI